MNQKLQEKLKQLPSRPGVYFHKSDTGEVIYVGKAAVLKNRVRQYFQKSRDVDLKTQALVSEIVDTDWIETDSETDALFLESEMVKRYMPRYNILLRDDKSQMFVRIDMKSEWPHLSFTRNPSDDGAEYYGPYYNSYALKKSLRYLRKTFPYYTREPSTKLSKLDSQLGLSPDEMTTPKTYKASLRKLIRYLKGERQTLMKEFERDMKQAADKQDFEKAALLRNRLSNLKELKRRIMFSDKEFLDISKDRALSDLKELFCLDKVPSRIEGYDISHMSGSDVVASMVVFTNGVSDRSEYRKFKSKLQKNDDYANMRNVVWRRMSQANRKSWADPQLMLIDGGKSQLDAAISALKERDISMPIISIAKREEQVVVHKTDSSIDTSYIESMLTNPKPGVFVSDEGDYYVINLHVGQLNASSHSKNLRSGDMIKMHYTDVVKLFQRIRDESHRFAISYHTVLKRKRQTSSKLEDIPGVGPATRRKLIKEFGSLRGVKQASKSDLVKCIGAQKAERLLSHL